MAGAALDLAICWVVHLSRRIGTQYVIAPLLFSSRSDFGHSSISFRGLDWAEDRAQRLQLPPFIVFWPRYVLEMEEALDRNAFQVAPHSPK